MLESATPLVLVQSHEPPIEQSLGFGSSNVQAYWRSRLFVFHSRPWTGSEPFSPRGDDDAAGGERLARLHRLDHVRIDPGAIEPERVLPEDLRPVALGQAIALRRFGRARGIEVEELVRHAADQREEHFVRAARALLRLAELLLRRAR